jgi:branched-chain amino acid transport system substrate-binding protein
MGGLPVVVQTPWRRRPLFAVSAPPRDPLRSFFPTLSFVAFITLTACGGQRSDEVALGAAGPWHEAYGRADSLGIELALAHINARPLWRERPLRIRFANDSARGDRAVQVAKSFVDDESITAVVGHINSDAMMAAARVYDGNLPAIATSATSPSLSGISPWAFRVVSSDSANGAMVASFVTQLGRRRAGVLYENNSYGRGLADAFRHHFSARGGVVESFDPLDASGSEDVEPFISFLKQRNVDVVFVATTDPAARAVIREVRKQKLSADIVGSDGWMPLVADTALAEGVYVGAPFTATDRRAETQAFVDAYRRRFGTTPDGYAALAYDATMLLAQAVERVGPGRTAVRDYLARLDAPYPGVTGEIRFSARGDAEGKAIVMAQIRAGALHAIAPR